MLLLHNFSMKYKVYPPPLEKKTWSINFLGLKNVFVATY